MNAQNNTQAVRDEITDILIDKGASKENIHDDAHVRNDLDMDSLDEVEAIMDMEKRFDIYVQDDLAEKLNTVGDYIKCAQCARNNTDTRSRTFFCTGYDLCPRPQPGQPCGFSIKYAECSAPQNNCFDYEKYGHPVVNGVKVCTNRDCIIGNACKEFAGKSL